MTFKNIIKVYFIFIIALASCEAKNTNEKPQAFIHNDDIMKLTASDTSGQIMNEDDFWGLIDKSRMAANNNYQTQITCLKTILLTLKPTEIVKFDNTFTALLAASYNYNLWGAAYVINGGCSDDCFDYFRQYLIGHGKDKFYETIKDPESCAEWIKSEEDDNWEGLQYSAMEAYKLKTGKEMPRTYQPKFELKGKPFDEKTVIKQYPKLAKKFMASN
ncbi:MAG TPA: DUF4240 domain-containing protein [Puia sp.]|nr:DUF4240 domain-containing protein [Puia sp.]